MKQKELYAARTWATHARDTTADLLARLKAEPPSTLDKETALFLSDQAQSAISKTRYFMEQYFDEATDEATDGDDE